jgi:hypothetical protein
VNTLSFYYLGTSKLEDGHINQPEHNAKNILLFSVLLALFACKKTEHTIELSNLSSKKFDSVNIYGSGTKIQFLTLDPGKQDKIVYEVTKKDIGDQNFSFDFFAKDTMIGFSSFYHSGPGDVPEKMKLVVGKDLKITVPPSE